MLFPVDVRYGAMIPVIALAFFCEETFRVLALCNKQSGCCSHLLTSRSTLPDVVPDSAVLRRSTPTAAMHDDVSALALLQINIQPSRRSFHTFVASALTMFLLLALNRVCRN